MVWSESLQRDPERLLHETDGDASVAMETLGYWRCQEYGRSAKKGSRCGDSLSLSEKLYMLQLVELEGALVKPFGAQLIILQAPHAEYEAAGFVFSLEWLSVCYAPVLPF